MLFVKECQVYLRQAINKKGAVESAIVTLNETVHATPSEERFNYYKSMII